MGFIVPGLPQPLLAPEQNEGWGRIRAGFDQARRDIEASDADVLLIYSTMWPSVVGHQIQARPEPEWIHVDELFHDLGSIPYKFKIDSEFAHALDKEAKSRGLQSRCVDYHGFPIDTGSVTALKLLNPDNRIPACILSSNMYSDRAETVVFAKAARQVFEAQGKKAVVVVVMTLSNRLFTEFIDPKDDRIHSPKDDEWNRKLLEFLGDGRLEDVAQLSRAIHKQIRVHKVVNFKPMWWLSAVMGQSNNYEGKVYAYGALYGTGGAVIGLTPTAGGVGDKEYDEDDVEVYQGERNVLATETAPAPPKEAAPSEARPTRQPARERPTPAPAAEAAVAPSVIRTGKAPSPVGAYPHARRVGDLLFISGMGPRQPGTGEIPGGPVRDASGAPLEYDVEAQTRAVIANIEGVCQDAGLALANVIDVSAFLIDMDRDFQAYNRVYAEHFRDIEATRTTVAVSALPTPIAVEFKAIAQFPSGAASQ
jgi:reactive intermediate/imine deaminase